MGTRYPQIHRYVEYVEYVYVCGYAFDNKAMEGWKGIQFVNKSSRGIYAVDQTGNRWNLLSWTGLEGP